MNRTHKTKTLGMIAAVAMMVISTAATQADIITVTDSIAAASARTANGADVTVTVSGWGLDGGNAVVVLFTAENSDGVTSATFAGETMTVVNQFDGDRFVASYAYLINPVASSGDVVINANNSPSSRLSNAYAVFSLANVGSLASSDSRTSNGALNYTTTLDGGYVLVAAVNNSFNASTQITASGDPDQTLFSTSVDGNQATLFAHGDVATAGSYSSTVTGSVESAVLVAFIPTAIPEPATLALFGLGGLMMIKRRKA